MHTTTFSNNPVQKCTASLFADLRLYDRNKHCAGEVIDIHYKGQSIGTAKILSFVCFHHENINDTISLLSFNKPASIVKTMLSRFYSPVTEKTVFVFLVMEWQTRNIELQEPLLQEWWTSQREANHKSNQASLFNY